MIGRYLDDLERRIDPEVEDDLWSAWLAFVDGEYPGAVFSPRRKKQAPAGLDWLHVPVNEALESYEMMALQQLSACSRALAAGSGEIMAVRCNYGTGIVPTIFGAELFVMDAQTDTLPTSIPLGGLESTNLEDSLGKADATKAAKRIRQLLDQGMPDLRTALGGKVLEMADYYNATFRRYPKIRRYVHIYHPDMQGPMDICELLWGSSLFVALVEVPSLVEQLLKLVTDTYASYMDTWREVVPFADHASVHWSMVHRGNIMIRDDSAMNLSPRMFERFIRPYDERLLKTFSGGALHFCGRGDHYIASASEMEGLTAVNLSQPEYNNMDTIFDHTVDKDINIIGLRHDAVAKALADGRDLRGRVHCW